ncbi:MAG TPA: hypothetical protein VFY10_06800 [Dehalococcoidia bacterium]|nr:hypothetical protein [Dehalococcoidia bacterium]
MTVYEFVTHLERAIDYARSRGWEQHEPVAIFAAPGKFWGQVSIRPKRLGEAYDGKTKYQFTQHQAQRMVDILRGRE